MMLYIMSNKSVGVRLMETEEKRLFDDTSRHRIIAIFLTKCRKYRVICRTYGNLEDV